MDSDYGTLAADSEVALSGADTLPSTPDYTISAGFDYTWKCERQS